MKKLVALLISSFAVPGQIPQHSVTLTWEDAINPVGTTYSVYRAYGPCNNGDPKFSCIAKNVSLKTYEDTTVLSGTYCYAVTATNATEESAKSPYAVAAVPGASHAFHGSALSSGTVRIK